ncbi:plasmid replication protein (plasmid) [Sulfuricella denitrificans skB26]|uniref:Plasmid replication protein n=1 Tax=Sulfuricella denitrificans (strain DSM 22764 / NBRC 105220 / skB26) TaxID=1163617 RepID=S6ADZ8_SULDS|nr:replication initiation protein [Sulfuricella denitrificans]BAN36833.1 plasmid replication protein [Sulfuricella denitrificans skB26]
MTDEAEDPELVPDEQEFPVGPVSFGGLTDNIVAKSNALVRASYKLNLQEQRLVLAAISKLDSRRPFSTPKHSQTSVRISAVEFGATFGIDKRKAYEELKEATNELFERRITEVNGKQTTKMRWVSKVQYHDGEGWAELTFSMDVLPLLTLLREKFTTYSLQRVAGLRSTYSIRIFEMLAQFSSTGLLRIDLADLIRQLDLPYVRYADVARRVIKPAVEELQVKSNLEIEWRSIKEGRAVKSIEFRFREAIQGKLDLAES